MHFQIGLRFLVCFISIQLALVTFSACGKSTGTTTPLDGNNSGTLGSSDIPGSLYPAGGSSKTPGSIAGQADTLQGSANDLGALTLANPAQQTAVQNTKLNLLDLVQALRSLATASQLPQSSDLGPAAQQYQAAWARFAQLESELEAAGLPNIAALIHTFAARVPVWRFYKITPDTRVSWGNSGRRIYHVDLMKAIATLIPQGWHLEGARFQLYKSANVPGCQIPVYRCSINPKDEKAYPETRSFLTSDTNCETPANNTGLAPRELWRDYLPLGYACSAPIDNGHVLLNRYLGQGQNRWRGDILELPGDNEEEQRQLTAAGYVLTQHHPFYVPVD